MRALPLESGMSIWRCYYRRAGNHVHCRLFCGPQEGALGRVDDPERRLTFRLDEFTEFTKIRKVIAVDFRLETRPDGSPDMEGSDVTFARLS
jgi:hypothetical protein